MIKRLLSAFLLVAIGTFAQAQTFVYLPKNPAFGGNTFNYSWLQSSAQSQDRSVDPTARRTSTSTTSTNNTLDAYSQSLQNQILSRITSSLVTKQFGEGELKPGTYRFGDFQVTITNGSDGVLVRIVDGKGGETTLTIPYF